MVVGSHRAAVIALLDAGAADVGVDAGVAPAGAAVAGAAVDAAG